MKNLYITGFLPLCEIPMAGHRLATLKCKELAKGRKLDVFAFCSHSEEAYLENLITMDNLNIHIIKFSKWDRYIAALLYPHLPSWASVRKYKGGKIISRAVSSEKYDEIYVDFSQAATLLPSIASCRRATLRIHDVQFQKFSRHNQKSIFKKIVDKIELLRSEFCEAHYYKLYYNLVVLSNKDRNILKDRYGFVNVEVEPPQPTYVLPHRYVDNIVPGYIIFFANFDRDENKDAVNYFTSKIFPKILNDVPYAKFAIVGAGDTTKFKSLCSERVKIVGFVENPLIEFSKANCAVVPLRFGAGVKIKTLETVKSGIPTIATTVGAEGIELNDTLRVSDDPDQFAALCVRAILGGNLGSLN